MTISHIIPKIHFRGESVSKRIFGSGIQLCQFFHLANFSNSHPKKNQILCAIIAASTSQNSQSICTSQKQPTRNSQPRNSCAISCQIWSVNDSTASQHSGNGSTCVGAIPKEWRTKWTLSPAKNQIRMLFLRHLSPSLQAFVSRLLGAEITKNIQEALRDLK